MGINSLLDFFLRSFVEGSIIHLEETLQWKVIEIKPILHGWRIKLELYDWNESDPHNSDLTHAEATFILTG